MGRGHFGPSCVSNFSVFPSFSIIVLQEKTHLIGINIPLECNHSKKAEGPVVSYSIKANIMLFMRKNRGCLQGVLFLKTYFSRIQNLFTLIERRQSIDSSQKANASPGWLYSLKV